MRVSKQKSRSLRCSFVVSLEVLWKTTWNLSQSSQYPDLKQFQLRELLESPPWILGREWKLTEEGRGSYFTCWVSRPAFLYEKLHVRAQLLSAEHSCSVTYRHGEGFAHDFKTGFGLDDSIYWHLTTLYTELCTSNCSATADLHTFQVTVKHVLGFSFFTSRILATDLSQSHCKFK
jgi:hypothetical protein